MKQRPAKRDSRDQSIVVAMRISGRARLTVSSRYGDLISCWLFQLHIERLTIGRQLELPWHSGYQPRFDRREWVERTIVYLQRQLGHASIQLTVDTYGKWLPMGNKAAVDRLDYVTSGSKMVATAVSGTKMAPVQFEQEPYIQALRMEPASGIEPPTCGLRIRPGLFLKRSVYQMVSPL